VDVKIASGAIIRENSIIVSKSVVGKNCKIGPFSEVKNSTIGEGASIKFSYVKDSTIERDSKIGPYNYINNNMKE
jgi:bifunctional UDP-N-acetylglucosamine pyrophosphorylase/glucosamine-1-phosphate N-acetyltransferase